MGFVSKATIQLHAKKLYLLLHRDPLPMQFDDHVRTWSPPPAKMNYGGLCAVEKRRPFAALHLSKRQTAIWS